MLWPCGGVPKRGSRTYPDRAGGREPAGAAARIASHRTRIPDWRRPWGRDGPAGRRACRSPASARRDGARGPGFPPRSIRELRSGVRDFRSWRETANTPGMSDTTPEKTKLSWWRRLSSGLKRTFELARDGGGRPRHQAQARPRHARGHRGRAAARRSGHGSGGAHFGGGGPWPLRQGDHGRRREIRGRDRSREGACSGSKAARHRRGAKAVRHSRGRRQRLRQDHHHRQAGPPLRQGRPAAPRRSAAQADTFRAAAVEQLRCLGAAAPARPSSRAQARRAIPAAVAFDATASAKGPRTAAPMSWSSTPPDASSTRADLMSGAAEDRPA